MRHPAPQRREGYLPTEDYGLVGDGRTAALVGRDGSLDWMCLPRFDAPAVFCALLDHRRGGRLAIGVEGLRAAEQRYVEDTAVLVTTMTGPEGVAELTDLMALRAGADLRRDERASAGRLVRRVRVLSGRVRLRVHVRPRDGDLERDGQGWRVIAPGAPDLALRLTCDRPLAGVESVVDLVAGEGMDLVLDWDGAPAPATAGDLDAVVATTVSAWRAWAGGISYQGPQRAAVRRSALTVKLLDHVENGAIVAAPTSSLPEHVGGVRNWDYRYCWVRDTAFSVHALRRIGLVHESDSFLAWVLAIVEREERTHLMYDVGGRVSLAERTDRGLEGYRRSAPVRWGNAAAEQTQHDVHGELLDCAYQWVRAGGRVGPALWGRVRWLADRAWERWRTPDHGIWEVRSDRDAPFTYSVALCHVALDRAARIATLSGHDAEAAAWARRAAHVRETLLREAWDPRRSTLTELVGSGGGVDASLLALPLRRVLAFDDPRMVSTTRAVVDRLGAGGGLLHRYDPAVSDDGLPGEEGAFLLCSFWWVDNLVGQGRLEEAEGLYSSLCARASPLGLLPEEVDPTTGTFLGNFPQAFSHIGVISSGIALSRALEGRSRRTP